MLLLEDGLFGFNKLAKRADEEDPQATPASLSALISTLVPVLIISAAMFLLFMILRRSQRRTYAPRTYIGSLREQERTPDLPNTLFGWIPALFRMPDTYVLHHHSIDAYLLLRYLKISTTICFVGCIITWPILFPVNATGGAGNKQLDILSMSNVTGNLNRYYAHTFVAWIFISFVFYMVTRESIYYINLRQAYHLSPLYASRISSRTVLFSSVPDDYLSEAKIRRMYGNDKVRNVWLATDTSDLQKKVAEREKVAMQLENAEIKLIKAANVARAKALKTGNDVESTPADNAQQTDIDGESGSVAARWIKTAQRPTHKLKPIIGKKVDTINWCRSEIERLTPEIEAEQARHRTADAKLICSVFVEFINQTEAQAAFQMVTHNLPLHMAPRYIGLNPGDVIWSNLRIQWWERIVRNAATIGFVVALIIFWAIPVAAVGSISNINSLIERLPWLGFINKMPKVLLGVITGLLPAVLMAVLMALLPIVLRLMAQLGGVPTLAAIELRTQNFYFAFQVVQVFLVATLASAASSAVDKIIQKPQNAANMLATNLPKASNFYISYFILQGLSFSSGALLQIAGLVVGKILGKLLDNTPRKMYKRWSTLSGLGWGTIFPILTNLCVIAITYSAIAPLVLGFATIGLYLFYFAYRYNMLYVSNTNIDTKGLVYSRALQQTTTGCYLLIVCLIGLFAIGTASDNAALGPLVLMIIFGVFCVLYHMSLMQALDPLLNYLPKNLEAEEEALLASEGKHTNGDGVPSSSGAAAGADGADPEKAVANGAGTTQTGKKPNFLAKFFRPDVYTNYAAMRSLVPSDFAEISYDPEVARDAYFHPSITADLPLLWIPRDAAGVSRQEVHHSSKVIPISDEDANLDENNKIVWNEDKGQPPIYEDKIYY
ncbi:hypothetical protein FQN54_006112 [Arachnomyces sp. PD_36]|nr:hypothetical protein FQN54_006112 [Arachnomyces sp. PD_36]